MGGGSLFSRCTPSPHAPQGPTEVCVFGSRFMHECVCVCVTMCVLCLLFGQCLDVITPDEQVLMKRTPFGTPATDQGGWSSVFNAANLLVCVCVCVCVCECGPLRTQFCERGVCVCAVRVVVCVCGVCERLLLHPCLCCGAHLVPSFPVLLPWVPACSPLETCGPCWSPPPHTHHRLRAWWRGSERRGTAAPNACPLPPRPSSSPLPPSSSLSGPLTVRAHLLAHGLRWLSLVVSPGWVVGLCTIPHP